MNIPYGKQDVTEADIEAVVNVLRSDFLTQGEMVPKFEHELSKITHVDFATAVNSATSALHLACLALGVSREDIVWTVPNTFVASANCALYCGASIDFVDVNPLTHNMSIEELELKLKVARENNALPKVVIPVHLTGEPCNMQAIYALSKQYNFRIIEDASHAVGAEYDGRPVGCCKYSDITIFSFHPVKIITSGEGGAALTNCAKIDKRLKLLRSHGITREKSLMHDACDDGWYYEQIDLGFNYRMTDIHAALGLSQLARLDSYIRKRHEIAEIYDKGFDGSNVEKPYRNPANKSALHLYVIKVDPGKHKSIFHALRAKNIGVNLHYIPVHTQPYYKELGFSWGDFPNSETYYKRAISLPIFPTLSVDEQSFVISTVRTQCDE